MSNITLKGNPVTTVGTIPAVGDSVENFSLVGIDLSENTLDTFDGKRKVLNIFPSVDTPTCALSVKAFNKDAAACNNTVVLNISADLPFALKRFCGAEGIDNAKALSSFRSNFSDSYGLTIADSVLKGLCSRVVIVLDEKNIVLHSEQVSEIANEPNYKAALGALS